LSDTAQLHEAILVSNGPGELYDWVQPVVRALRATAPPVRIVICLVPDQFVSGAESRIARTFDVDAVISPSDYLQLIATGRHPAIVGRRGFVLSLGGALHLALRVAERLAYPLYRYSFTPSWHRYLRRLFVHDQAAYAKAKRLGAPPERLTLVGNLVADAVLQSAPIGDQGTPHILLMGGTRDAFARSLIPFNIALADRLGQRFPKARFIWPVSRLLSPAAIADGIAARELIFAEGLAGRREGERIITPQGSRIEMVDESTRYAHMRVSDLAVTIPGTNTLELGIAGVVSLVLLPLNKPEVIPLEGIGQWLGYLPLIGKPIKRFAVRLFVNNLNLPISLPNRFTKEALMVEIKGKIEVATVAERAIDLLSDDGERLRRRARLLALMPKAGAAARLVQTILEDEGIG
jgi:lipid-A-disaccharide synthase